MEYFYCSVCGKELMESRDIIRTVITYTPEGKTAEYYCLNCGVAPFKPFVSKATIGGEGYFCPKCTKQLKPLIAEDGRSKPYVYVCRNDTCSVYDVIIDTETGKATHYSLKE